MDPTKARQQLEEKLRRLEETREAREGSSELDESQQESLGSLSSADQHPADIATNTLERSVGFSIEDQLDRHIEEIEGALERIEQDTYGTCAECGEAIDPERLQAIPETRYCIEHQETTEESA